MLGRRPTGVAHPFSGMSRSIALLGGLLLVAGVAMLVLAYGFGYLVGLAIGTAAVLGLAAGTILVGTSTREDRPSSTPR